MDTAGDGAGDRAQKMAARWFPSVTWAAGPASLCWGEIWQTWPPAQQLPLPDPASMPCLRSLLNNSCFECIQAVGLISAIRWHLTLPVSLPKLQNSPHICFFGRKNSNSSTGVRKSTFSRCAVEQQKSVAENSFEFRRSFLYYGWVSSDVLVVGNITLHRF